MACGTDGSACALCLERARYQVQLVVVLLVLRHMLPIPSVLITIVVHQNVC